MPDIPVYSYEALRKKADEFLLKYHPSARSTRYSSLVTHHGDTVEQLRENVGFAASFAALAEDEKEMLSSQLSPIARQLMYYKP